MRRHLTRSSRRPVQYRYGRRAARNQRLVLLQLRKFYARQDRRRAKKPEGNRIRRPVQPLQREHHNHFRPMPRIALRYPHFSSVIFRIYHQRSPILHRSLYTHLETSSILYEHNDGQDYNPSKSNSLLWPHKAHYIQRILTH